MTKEELLRTWVREVLREELLREEGFNDDRQGSGPEVINHGVSKPGGIGDKGKKRRLVSKQKVLMFTRIIKQTPKIMHVLGLFTTPVEQAQAIVAFASLVGVPSSQIPQLVSDLRNLSRGGQQVPDEEAPQ
jgi:hypothetical protein